MISTSARYRRLVATGVLRQISLTVCVAVTVCVALSDRAAAWRQEIDGGTGFTIDGGWAVALDAAGNSISAGTLAPPTQLIVKHRKSDGVELWRYTLSGFGVAMALDASGNVLVTGVEVIAGDQRLVVVKVNGVTGTELWRKTLGSPGPIDDYGKSVAVDSLGDVVVGGAAGSMFFLAKLSGINGTLLWSVQDVVLGSKVYAVTVGATNDVFVAGALSDGIEMGFYALRFHGATGVEAWRHKLGRMAFYEDMAAIRIDGTGDVVLAGAVTYPSFDEDFVVAKLAGSTGAQVWLTHVLGDEYTFETANALALTASGDVVAVGRAFNHAYIIAISGASGAELWHRQMGQAYSYLQNDPAMSVAIDPTGAIVVGGSMSKGPRCERAAVFKLAAATGATLWTHLLTVVEPRFCGSGHIRSVAVDDDGEIVATGAFHHYGTTPQPYRDSNYFVEKLDGVTGQVGPVPGAKLLVQDHATLPTRRKVSILLKDTSVTTDPPSSAGDPILNGGAIRILNPTTAESTTFLLPAGATHWHGLGHPAGTAGYKYGDASGTNGPCTSLLARRGQRIKALCIGTRGTIPFTLNEATQGSLTVSIRLGNGAPQCGTFGGKVVHDQGTSNPGPAASFLATGATAPIGDCIPTN